MKGIGLCMSPNWYCSRVADINHQKIYAFGARNNVILLNCGLDPPQYEGVLVGHSERVVAVRFCDQEKYSNRVISGSEDGSIKLWDTVSRIALKEHREHKNKITCIDWSSVEPDIVAGGDDKGNITLWNLATFTCSQFLANKGAIVVLSFSPHEEHILAVGFRQGLILLLDVFNNGAVIHLMRRHITDVQSINWAPVKSQDLKTNFEIPLEDDYLLASSSRDGFICFWSSSQGKLIGTLKVPASNFRYRNQDDSFKLRGWITLCWPQNTPNSIICSNHFGEIVIGDLSSREQEKWKRFESSFFHIRPAFNISRTDSLAVSLSMDRQIILWDLEQLKAIHSLPTLGGFVYSLQFSPLNSAVLAIGVGDNMIRIWNLQSPNSAYSVKALWQGIQAKVTSVSWHPKQEGILAFGTEEGRVGVFNTLVEKTPIISNSVHKGTIYTVCWGPLCHNKNNGEESGKFFCLYSCGDGRVLLHNPKLMDKDAKDLNDLIACNNSPGISIGRRSEVVWKPDFSLIALGNEDGSIEIFRPPELKRLIVITEQRKLIQSLVWHPPYITASSTKSPCSYWLASASNETYVHIYDLEKPIETAMSTGNDIQVNQSSCQLSGHRFRVVSLAWSPHEDGHLVSGSYDGTVQVWNGIQGKPIANFRGHIGRVFSVQWSSQDPDVIFSGGEDFTLQQWRISEQEFKIPPSKQERRKFNRNKKKVEIEDEEEDEENQNTEEFLKKLLEKKRQELLNVQKKIEIERQTENKEIAIESKEPKKQECQSVATTNSIENGFKNENIEVRTVKSPVQSNRFVKEKSTSKKKRRKAFKSMFPVSASLENRSKNFILQDILNLNHHIYKEGKESNKASLENINTNGKKKDEIFGCGDLTHLGLYGNHLDCIRCLKTEGQYHKEQDNLDYTLQLEIWKGNIKGALDIAKSHNQLEDWLIALAPLASPAVWREMCQAYSKQLISQGNPLKAALYLLAIHDVYGAIEVLKSSASYREALALAKTRLSPDDPVLHKLVMDYAASSELELQYENAAKCYLSCGKPSEAARVLALRYDPNVLQVAASLALDHGNAQLAKACSHQSLMDFLQRNEINSAKEVISQHKGLKEYQCVITLHEVFQEELNKLKPDETKKPSGNLWPSHLVEEKPFLYYMLDLWKEQKIIDLGDAQFVYERLLEDKIGWQEPQTQRQAVLRSSLLLSLTLLANLTNNNKQALTHLADLLSVIHNCGYLTLFQHICQLLLPSGLASIQSMLPNLDSVMDKEQEFQDIFESVQGYLSLGSLHCLLKKNSLDSNDTIDIPENKGDTEIETKTDANKETVSDEEICSSESPSAASPGINNSVCEQVLSKSETSDLSLQNDIFSSSAQQPSIEELTTNLLVDSRAQIYVLQTELTHVQVAISKKAALGKDYTKSVNDNFKIEDGHSNGPSSDAQCTDNETVQTNETSNIQEHVMDCSNFDKDNQSVFNISALSLDCNDDSKPEASEPKLQLLSVDERYLDPSLELIKLQEDRSRIELQLSQLQKKGPFPNPVESAMMILEYMLTHCPSDINDIHDVINWARRYAPSIMMYL